MSATLPGIELDVSADARATRLSQWYTPARLAFRCWGWTWRQHSPARLRILEPACGRGALIAPVFQLGVQFSELDAYDIDADNIAHVQARYPRVHAVHADFIEETGLGKYDVSVFNPPYEGGKDVDFCERVCGCSQNAIAILRTVFLNGKRRGEFFRWHDIRRMAVLCERPDFGGEYGAKADFVVLDLRRRRLARKQGEACTSNVEWWSP